MIRSLRAIARADPPAGCLLATEADRPGAHADAFHVAIARPCGLESYLTAFFTTPVFRAERRILGLAGFPGGVADVAAMARGSADRFAVWHVAKRPSELLLRDVTGRTRTWLRVEDAGPGARLWFGSAILPARAAPRLDMASRLILGPHRAYSRILLASAAARLDAA